MFVYAVIPGYVAVLAYEFRRPPLRHRSTLRELARILLASVFVWALAWWLGAQELIVDLADPRRDSADDLAQRVYWLTVLVLVLAGVLGVAGRWIRRRLEVRGRIESADDSWDRLLIRLHEEGEAVLLRIRLRSGGDVFGAFAERGRADWQAEGSGVLLDVEATPDESGVLSNVAGSRGVYVPGDEIAAVSVVRFGELTERSS